MVSIQPVAVASSDGWVLPGELRRPAKANGACVLFLHQLRRDRHTFDALADALAANGFTTLAVDSRGHGDAKINGRPKSWELFDEAKGEFKGLTDDAQSALNALIDAAPGGRVFVVGSSVGATNAVMLAARSTHPIAGVVLLSVGLNYRGVDCRRDVDELNCPSFVAASREDGYADHCSEKIARALRARGVPVVWVRLADAGHGTDMLRYDGLFERVTHWMCATAIPPAPISRE